MKKTLTLTALCWALYTTASAQTSAFTYQGMLNDGGQPANGSYDLAFALFDAENGGNAIAALTNAATGVTNGLFNARLDFGAAVFTGDNYWLEVGVRTNGGDSFFTLAPRQPITSTPYALHAADAGLVSAANIVGTIADSQLSANVALLGASPTFTGKVAASSFSGNGLTNVPGTIVWRVIAETNLQAESNARYLLTNDTQVTLTLPSSPNPGDAIHVYGRGLRGWTIAQNGGQSITGPGRFLNCLTWSSRVTTSPWTCIAASADGTKIAAGCQSSTYAPLQVSSDSGNSWKAGIAVNYLYQLAMSPDGNKLVALAGSSPAYVYTSADGGLTGASVNNWSASNPRAVAMSADGVKLFVATAYSGKLYYSPNAGAEWFDRSFSGVTLNSIACSADGTRLVGAGSSGYLYVSTNSAASWTSRGPSRAWAGVASSADGSQFVATVNGGVIATSSDFGVTWRDRNSSTQAWISVISSADGTRLAATVANGPIYVSLDFGLTWVPQNSGSRNWSALAASADGTKLFATVNGGQIWTAQPATVPTSTVGTSGGLIAPANSNIELLHVGGGKWTVVNASDSVFAF